MEDPTKKARV